MLEEFNVISHVVKNQTLVFKLSWLQRLVCRLFKIIPEKFFYYEVKIKTNPPYMVMRNDILMSIDGALWDVTNIDEDQQPIIRNINPLQYLFIQSPMIVYSRIVGEQTTKTI